MVWLNKCKIIKAVSFYGPSFLPRGLRFSGKMMNGDFYIRTGSYIYYEIIRLSATTKHDTMKTSNNRWWLTAGMVSAIVIFCAWKAGNETGYRNYREADQDTIPRKKLTVTGKNEYRIGDLDGAMKDLDRAMEEMNKNLKFDFSKMDKEMKAAMDEMKKIDFDKVGKEIEASMKSIDWDKTRVEIDAAMREAKEKFREVDMEKVKKEIARAKEQLSEEKLRTHVDMQKIKESVDAGLRSARIGMEKAKKELSMFKEFTGNLEKDGLIEKNKPYKIEIKSGEMYINGTKQSKEVNDKYRKYFRDEDYTIRSDKD